MEDIVEPGQIDMQDEDQQVDLNDPAPELPTFMNVADEDSSMVDALRAASRIK